MRFHKHIKKHDFFGIKDFLSLEMLFLSSILVIALIILMFVRSEKFIYAVESLQQTTYIASSSGTGIEEKDGSSPVPEIISLGNAVKGRPYLGLRFTQGLLPEEAEIVSARIQLTSPLDQNIAPNIYVYGEMSLTPQIFSNKDRPDQRNYTKSLTALSTELNWPIDTKHNIDVTDQVKEIVAQHNFVGGSPIAFIFKNMNTSPINVMIYNAGSLAPPELHIIYKLKK